MYASIVYNEFVPTLECVTYVVFMLILRTSCSFIRERADMRPPFHLNCGIFWKMCIDCAFGFCAGMSFQKKICGVF